MADTERDWIDILAKLLPGLSALLAGILVPLVIHVNGERSRQNQLYAEIVSKREAADSDLRAKMFQNLISAFYGDQANEPRNKFSLLRLLALNFHEFFDLKPLFEDLQTNLNAEDRKRFQAFLRELAGKQEAMLLHGPGVQFFNLHLGEGLANGMTVPDNNTSYQGHRLGVTATEINAKEEYVLMQVIDLPDSTDKRTGTLAEVRFKLTYGSLPFIDNTKLFDGTRFAVTLEQFNEGTPKSADIKIIFFPESYMSSRDRPYMDEMINQLHDNIQRK